MKKRTFGDGGEIPPGGRFDSDTYARARKWMEAGSPDNRSEEPAKAPKSAAKPSTTASYSNGGKDSKPAASPKVVSEKNDAPAGEIPKDKDVKAPAATERDRGRPTSDFERNVLNTVGAVSGLRGIKPVLMAGKKAAEVASSGSRALAKSETPVTFLGASGRKNVTPKGAIGTTSNPQLKGPTSGDRIAQSPGPKSLPPAKTAADTPKLPAPKEPTKAPTPSKPAVKEKTVRAPARMSPNKKTKPAASKKADVSMGDKKPVNPRSRTSYDDMPGVEYKKGGVVRGTGAATRGKKFSGVY